MVVANARAPFSQQILFSAHDAKEKLVLPAGNHSDATICQHCSDDEAATQIPFLTCHNTAENQTPVDWYVGRSLIGAICCRGLEMLVRTLWDGTFASEMPSDSLTRMTCLFPTSNVSQGKGADGVCSCRGTILSADSVFT